MTANVTNTVALVLNSVGSVSASRPELRGQGRRLLPLAVAAVLGGTAGAVLLLLTPSGAVRADRAVPDRRRLRGDPRAAAAARAGRRGRTATTRCHRDPRWLALGTFAIAIYGGYFGAAAGVLMLAMFLLGTGETLPRGNAMKNLVLGVANAVAAVGFVVFASIAWSAALPLAIGLFVGGLLGPRVVRRAPQTALRRVIAVAGLGLAVRLGIQAFT